MSKVVFETLTIDKFSCIETASIPLDSAGLCCIEGRIYKADKDLPEQIYQRSNGAGKSSVVEAFYFVLTGEFFDSDTTLGSIINRFTGSPAKLTISGKKDDVPFFINRTVDSKSKRSKVNHSLEFVFGEQKIHEQTNSILQTQERINEFLGISSLLLLNSKIFGQGDISSFTNVNDRHKKIIIDNLVGVGICDKLCKTSKSMLSETTTTITTLNVELMGDQKNRDALDLEVQELAKKEWVYEQEKKAEENKLFDRITEVAKEIKELHNEIKAHEISKQQLKGGPKQLETLDVELEKAEALHQTLKTKVAEFNTDKNKYQREQSFLSGKLQNTLDTIRRLVDLYKEEGKICPTCLQKLDQENFDELCSSLRLDKEHTEKQVDEYDEKIKLLEDTSSKWISAEKDLLSKVTALKLKIKEMGVEAVKERNIKQKIHDAKHSIQAKEREIEIINANMVKVSTQSSPFTDMMRGKAEQVQIISDGIEDKKKQIEALEIEQRYYNLLVKAFDKDGIPQLISTDVLKILNRILTKYKDQILGQNFDAEYRMKQKRNNEEIHLHVVNPDGGEGYSRQSKGEKRKIDLCQMFTISDFAKMQNKCNLNVIWFDEIFSELDPHSCEVVLEIIKGYSAESKFIITHKDLFKDEFKHRIFVQKTGSTSTVKVNY